MNHRILAFVLLLAAIGAGCQQADPPAAAPAEAAPDASAAETPAPAQDTWDASSSPVPGTRIEVKPGPVSFCDEKRQVVEVEWDMAAANPAQLQLWVEDARGKRNLWIATKTPAGSKRSGNWAMQGTKFVALDARHKRVINSATIPPETCTP